MSWNVVGVLGVVATLVFGVLSIRLARSKRYPGELTFIRECSLGLFDSIVRNLPQLSIRYDDQPVSQGLVLLKGFLVNTGAKDITEDMVAEQVALTLPDGYKCLTARVVSSSPAVCASAEIKGQDLTLATGLFRCREHLALEALAEVPIGDAADGSTSQSDAGARLWEVMGISHRIADTSPIASQGLPRKPGSLRSDLRMAIVQLVVMTAFILVMFVLPVEREIHYMLPQGAGPSIEVAARPISGGRLRVRAISGDYDVRVSPDQFFATDGLRARVAKKHHTVWEMLVALGFILGLVLSLAVPVIRRHRRYAALYELLHLGDRQSAAP